MDVKVANSLNHKISLEIRLHLLNLALVPYPYSESVLERDILIKRFTGINSTIRAQISILENTDKQIKVFITVITLVILHCSELAG